MKSIAPLALALSFFISNHLAHAAPVSSDACVSAMNARDGSLLTHDSLGSILHGFASAMYSEDAPTRASIILETHSQVYFYSEDCDESATMYVCEKSSASVSEYKTAHTLSCADLPATSASDVVYTSCNAN
jgi:hypothetical protein